MAWIKLSLGTILCVSTIQLYANTTASAPAAHTAETQPKIAPPYGDNPNIFKVLAYKTGQKIHKTADQVGDATEQGIEKVKPKVEEAIDAVTGSSSAGKAPIERKSLSQSSSNYVAGTSSAVATTPAVTAASSASSHAITEEAAEIQRIPQQAIVNPEQPQPDNKQSTPQPQTPSDNIPQNSEAPVPQNVEPQQKPTVQGITQQSDDPKAKNKLAVISL